MTSYKWQVRIVFAVLAGGVISTGGCRRQDTPPARRPQRETATTRRFAISANDRVIDDPVRSATLLERRPLVEKYLSVVEQRVATLRKESGEIPGMLNADWRRQLDDHAARKPFSGFQAAIMATTRPWLEDPPDLSCNVMLQDQFSVAAISPIIRLEVPTQDLRFDWYIKTGDAQRDGRLVTIVTEALQELCGGADKVKAN